MGFHAKWNQALNLLPMTGKPIDDLLDPVPNWLQYDNIGNNPDMTIYTDGSKIGEGDTGYGWLATIQDTIVEQENGNLGDNTVYKAELFAIYTSLQWLKANIKEKYNYIKSCVIKSDSQASILAIIASPIKSSLVLMIKELMEDLKSEIKIGIEWIKGHSNQTGNEIADMLAKEGTKLTTYGCQPFLPISKATAKKPIEEYIYKLWQKRWTSESTCKISATASTNTPTVRSPIWTTIIACRSVGVVAGIPNLFARSTTGRTDPRRLITPRK